MSKKYLDDNGLLYFWGKLKAYFATKTHSHTKSEITDFPSSMTPTSHTHGNITNAGALQTTDVAIANGDKLVVTDSSNSSKVARTSTSFDGSTTTKALTQKGTFETFLQEHQDISGKVDKVSGKGLSTNDYTQADKTKLSGIAAGATADSPSSTTPKMDGTATVGTETAFARGDHIHPSDTTRVPTSRTINGKALSSDITLWSTDIDYDQDSTIKDYIDAKAWGNGRIFYGTCSTDAGTAEKAVVCSRYTGFQAGDLLVVLFSSDNTASNPTLNVNSKGAKPIKMVSYIGSTGSGWEVINPTYLEAHTPLLFMYNNNSWVAMIDTIKIYSGGTASQLETGTVTTNYLWTPKILHDYVEGAISTAISGTASFQGTAPTTFAPTNYKAGWYWLVDTAGTYAGKVCEAGDLIYAISDYSSAYSANDFTVVQNNLDLADISNSDIDIIVAS